ncbi:MAG: DNA-binding response regulator, partial [Christensenellaceae bacterium]
MLLKIAICDDESGICNNLEEMIMHYQKNSARNFEIEVYFSAEMLYEAMKINSGFDLIFLDIEFKYTSGV